MLGVGKGALEAEVPSLLYIFFWGGKGMQDQNFEFFSLHSLYELATMNSSLEGLLKVLFLPVAPMDLDTYNLIWFAFLVHF